MPSKDEIKYNWKENLMLKLKTKVGLELELETWT
jgi:hypothetical protein